MARADRPYRRLPGRKRRLSGSATLWRAGDHLMLVQTGMASETYRRFYFRDIQSIVLRRTNDFIGRGVFLALVTLFFGSLAGGRVFGVLWPWLVLLAGAVAFLLVHLARGATCAIHLTTSLGTQALTPLERVRQARRALDRIRPAIEAAQGSLPADVLLAQSESIPGPAAFPAPSPAAAAGPPPLIRRGDAWPHAVLSGVLVLDAVVTGFQLSERGGPIDLAGYVVFIVLLAAAILAIVKQADTDLPRGLRRFATVTLICVAAIFTISLITSMAQVMRAAVLHGADPPMMVQAVRHRVLSVIEIVVDAALSIWGLTLLLQRRREAEARWIRLGT